MSAVADLLTHVLVAYVLATVLSWRVAAIGPPLVVAAMAGAVLPDLRKVYLVVPDDAVAATVGVPFSWAPLHRLGGVVVCLLLAAVLVDRHHRTRTVLLLALGALTHLVLDGLLAQPDGRVFEVFWPITTYGIPLEGYYVSYDVWPLAIALVAAVGVAAWSRRRNRPSDRKPTGDPDPPAGVHSRPGPRHEADD